MRDARLSRGIWRGLLLALAVMLLWAVPAQAGTKKKGEGKKAEASAKAGSQLTSVLDELSWGMSSKQVTAALEARVWAEFDVEAAEIGDSAKKDKLRKLYKSRIDRLKESHKQLKNAERSGLDVSVVADEFVNDNGESVITVKDDKATRYYFFLDDELYKVSVAYDPSTIGDLAFDSFVALVERKYGKAKATSTDEEGFFAQALWEDGDTRLRVDDKWATYDTYLMSFAETSRESRVAAKHKAHIEARYSEPEVSAEIDALTQGEDNMGRSAADALLGGDTTVDLKAGLPQEDLDAMAEEEALARGETTDKGGVSEKKAKKKKKKDTRKKKDFKDLEKAGEEKGLIIY